MLYCVPAAGGAVSFSLELHFRKSSAFMETCDHVPELLLINLDSKFIAVTLFIKTLPKSKGDIFRVRRQLSCSFL